MPVSTRLPSGSLLPVLLPLGAARVVGNARGDEPTAGLGRRRRGRLPPATRRASWSSRPVVDSGRLVQFPCPPRDVWSSADGVRWERVLERAPWRHADLPTSLVFDDRMWMMGGWHLGRLPGASGGDEVWFSRDGAEWERATSRAGWTPRLGAAGAVFNGKMWILGGSEQYFWDRQEPPQRCSVLQRRQGVEREYGGRSPRPPRAIMRRWRSDNKLWFSGATTCPGTRPSTTSEFARRPLDAGHGGRPLAA